MKQTGLKRSALVLALALALTQGSQAASLNTAVNAKTVAVGDQFQLTVTTDITNGVQPDLTPLQQDFEVHGTSQSMRTQIINGRQSQERSWIITLSPKETGQLVIPQLSAAGLTSQPLSISVLEPDAMPKFQGVRGVEIQARLAEDRHYLYQEIPLVVRIETPHSIKKAELVAPSGSEFELTQNGQDRTSTIMRNGQQLSVIERHYHLRPQQTGPISLAPFTIRGEVEDPNSRRSPFGNMPFGSSMMRDFPFGGSAFGGSLFSDMFSRGTPFVARSDALSLNVEAAAGAETGEWFLPSKSVKLQSQWQPENPEFKVGEAVTRQISILALGARPEQLPDLQFDAPDGARIYVDESKADQFNTAEGTIGRRTIMTSVVPTQSGEITLPEITMQWWDTDAGETRTAHIPAETINATGSVAAAVGPVETRSEFAESSAAKQPGANSILNTWTFSIGAAVFALIAAFIWFLSGKSKPALPKQAVANPQSRKSASSLLRQNVMDALASLRNAAKSGNLSKTYHAALNWQRCVGNSAIIPDSFNTHLRDLECVLYQPENRTTDWNSQALLKIAQDVSRKFGESDRKSGILPALYPKENRPAGWATPHYAGS